MWPKIKENLIKYETKIVLALGFILVAAISYEAGVLNGAKISQKPVVIEQKTADLSRNQPGSSNLTPPEALNLAQEASKNQGSPNIPSQNCAFVASKNSNKYHLPTCRWARNIKPENLVCFTSKEDAAKKGYQPDANCIK